MALRVFRVFESTVLKENKVTFPGVAGQAFVQHFTASLTESAKNHTSAVVESCSSQQTRVFCPGLLILIVLLQQVKASICIYRPLLLMK